MVFEKPRVFQTAGDIFYTVALAALVAFWTIGSIWPFRWLGGERYTAIFCLVCTLIGAGFWCALLVNRRRSWTQRSPMMRYTVAEFEALDPHAQAALAVQDEQFHVRWKARRARRQRWNVLRLFAQR